MCERASRRRDRVRYGRADEKREAAGTVVVSAINRPWCIAKSILSAGLFDRCVHTPLLDADGRARIERLYSENMERIPLATSDLVDVMMANAAEAFSDADIAGACRRTSVSSNNSRIYQCPDINNMCMIY